MNNQSEEIDLKNFLPYDPNFVTYSDLRKTHEKKAQQVFNGLTKDQIVSYASDPKWVRARWILFALFWLVWIVMLVGAILIVVYTPKCPYRPKLNFYDRELIYQIDVEMFKDSDNDLKGDLQGLIEKLNYFDEIGVKTLLLEENILNHAQPDQINPDLGSNDDIKILRNKLNENDMHLIFDVPIDVYEKNKDSVLEWLKEYVDGIRIIVNSPNSINNFNETITNLVEKVNQIAKDVFKPKCIATYPFSENFGQSKLIDSSMLRITESIVNNTAGLIQKIKDLYAQDNSNPAFVLGDFNWKRLSEHFTDESLIHLYHSIALLLKGTPMILYGDEIELKDNDLFMKWNNQINCGFSSSNAKSNQIECSNNVGMKLARGETLPRIYKKLSKLRQEPSFSWGEIYFPSDKHNNLISFVRKANGFDGYLVVANTGKSESSVDFKKLFKDLSDNARVEYFYSYNNEFKDAYKFNDIIKLNNIYLKKGEILVAKFDNI